MKGGSNHRLKGRNLSLTLVVLIITTIGLWAWEKNPFANTLLSAQERYINPSSGLCVSAYMCTQMYLYLSSVIGVILT